MVQYLMHGHASGAFCGGHGLPYPYPLGSHHSVGIGSWHRAVPDAWLSAIRWTYRTVLVSCETWVCGPPLRIDSKQRLHGCGRWDEQQFALALTWGAGDRTLLLGALTERALMPDTVAAHAYRNPIRNRGKMRPMCPMRQGDVSHYVELSRCGVGLPGFLIAVLVQVIGYDLRCMIPLPVEGRP